MFGSRWPSSPTRLTSYGPSHTSIRLPANIAVASAIAAPRVTKPRR